MHAFVYLALTVTVGGVEVSEAEECLRRKRDEQTKTELDLGELGDDIKPQVMFKAQYEVTTWDHRSPDVFSLFQDKTKRKGYPLT